MEFARVLLGLLLCAAGAFVQRKACGIDLYNYLFGGHLWLAGLIVMLS